MRLYKGYIMVEVITLMFMVLGTVVFSVFLGLAAMICIHGLWSLWRKK